MTGGGEENHWLEPARAHVLYSARFKVRRGILNGLQAEIAGYGRGWY